MELSAAACHLSEALLPLQRPPSQVPPVHLNPPPPPHPSIPIRNNPLLNYISSRSRFKPKFAFQVKCLSHSCSVTTDAVAAAADDPILMCETRTLPPVLSLPHARQTLLAAVQDLHTNPPRLPSGLVRFQVPFSMEIKALKWLQSQKKHEELLPRFYFSSRGQRGKGFHEEDIDILKGIAGIGSAMLFNGKEPFSSKDIKRVKRFLSKDSSLIRAYGAIRFNADMEPSEEWKSFGSFFFFIPQIEFCECPTCNLLVVTIAWDKELGRAFEEAIATAKTALLMLSDKVSTTIGIPMYKKRHTEHVPSEQEWHGVMKDLSETLEANLANTLYASEEIPMDSTDGYNAVNLSKVVLARKTKVEVDAVIEPLALLSVLQEKDPNAYQFCIQLPNENAFIGSTPERLFYKDGIKVFSEAVAGTRARGITESKDNGSGIELLLSPKDHTEFDIVVENIKQRLEVVCKDVKVKSYKSLLKQANVQHLYGRLVGQLVNANDEFHLLTALHPTPAVCGHPQHLATRFLSEKEAFDRGMYAGPLGWISGDKSEFAVAIRSSLLSQNEKEVGTCLNLYAGVGIVKGANSVSEWRELNLKIKQFETLLQPISPLTDAVNINVLWANLIVEECCRLGVTYFCIAPGSRSSPLAVAAAENYKATCISCIDERSLAFHALGYGRGACKPAVVITSSGTAVSNLLPAVVEAHEDCIPLVLLTADRPPELQQTGANQTIDQAKHFGSFLRHQIILPPPSADIQSRMVLTSIDAAIFRTSSDPMGPVHINISFREPLAGIPHAWNTDCLKGLGRWTSNTLPFTKYVKMMKSNSTKQGSISCGDIKEIAETLSSTSRGILVIGGLHKLEESWNAILLAKHLGWPVVPDILSGVRLRHLNSYDVDELCIIDYFDHMLLSTQLQHLIKPDVVLQIGGRFTSNRLLQFLEDFQPASYILVEEHPFRHDPSHLLTHRVQSPITEFVKDIMSCCSPSQPGGFAKQLQLFSDVIGKEISFQLDAELTLSEPHVARIVANSLTLDSALFLGNSMSVRDSDMYCEGALRNAMNLPPELYDLPWSFIRVAGNRGASGIDGILSTAIGFAAGCGQRVTLLLGDISFLHDTNGLMLLNGRVGQPPVVVVVINNSGGGIFSLLPIANTVSATTFTKLFTTPQDVSIRQLCLAHRVNHTLVRSRKQLVEALEFIQSQQLSWIVEVESSVKENSETHRHLQNSTKQAIKRALQVFERTDGFSNLNLINFIIQDVVFHRYRFQLTTPPTTMQGTSKKSEYRDGFIFRICLNNGVYGYGEVAPLEGLHKETLKEVEDQLQLLGKLLQNIKFNNSLAFLDGNFSKWLSKVVGILPDTLFPSVRCGLEMAVLGALASANDCSIAELLNGNKNQKNSIESGYCATRQRNEASIRICALLDSYGSPVEMALSALTLVQKGFCTLKIKVARRISPLEDAAVLVAIREAVGPRIHLRADANQRWTFDQAVEFANAVRDCELQYLEEPVKDLGDLVKFCKDTGVPVALDESIDRNPDEIVKLFPHLGLSAVIIKPSAVGGFERAAHLAKCAQRHGILAVISSAFESSISLSAYAQFASFVDERWLESITANDVDRKVVHGLGTYMWLESDVVCENRFSVKTTSDGIEISIQDAANILRNVVLNKETVQDDPPMINMHSQVYTVKSYDIEYDFHVSSTQRSLMGEYHDTVLVFLHGFLGSAKDWLPIMHGLSMSYKCVSIDLPGHGKTTISGEGKRRPSYFETSQALDSLSMENVAQALSSLFRCLSKKKVILIGYSMGARIALYMALRFNIQVLGAVIISGSPGIEEPMARKNRAKQDHALSQSLLQTGLESFIATWYQKQMWSSLRSHPCFANLLYSRLEHQDSKLLARILSSLSVGKQQSLWGELADPPVPLLIVAGKKDKKFMEIARKMWTHSGHSKFSADRYEAKLEGKILGNENGVGKVVDKAWELKEMMLFHNNSLLGNEIDKCHRFPLGQLQSSQDDNHRGEMGKRKFLLEVENTGHAVHLENPMVLVSGIRNFVSKLQ